MNPTKLLAMQYSTGVMLSLEVLMEQLGLQKIWYDISSSA